ncbi:MAG: hypothetical protein WD042_20120 [Phycisphaeraceae bacterium]
MTAPDDADQGVAPSPRAFAQGVGVLLQTVGMVLCLSTCCICAGYSYAVPTLTRGQVERQTEQAGDKTQPGDAIYRWRDLTSDPGKAGLTAMVMFTTVGGLALASFGLGLQSEKPRSAWGALISAGLMTIVLLACGVGLWLGHASLLARLWHAGLLVAMLLLVGFSAAAVRQMRRFPPPVDLYTVPRDFDEAQYKKSVR